MKGELNNQVIIFGFEGSGNGKGVSFLRDEIFEITEILEQ